MTSIEQILSPDHIKEVINRNAKSLITSAVLGAILLGGYYYFRVYRVEQDARAHATLTEVLAEVSRASGKPEVWQDVEMAARTGYRSHSNSALAPYFLAIEADALVQQGKVDEGREQLASVVGTLPAQAPLTQLFALKLARMQVSSPDQEIHSKGIAGLQALAKDTRSVVHDEALYRLGKVLAHENQTQEARQAFEQLITTYKETKDAAGQSVWASLAQEQIDRLA